MPFVMPHKVGVQRNEKHSLKYFQYFLSGFGVLYHFVKLFFTLGAFFTVLNHKESENLTETRSSPEEASKPAFFLLKMARFSSNI